MSRLFEYRFEEGEGLGGHSFGNLFIVAMTEVAGNFEEAVRETSRASSPCAARSCPPRCPRSPSARAPTTATVVRGESSITEHGHVKEVFLDPPTIQANPDAIRAILQADLIVCGPGSLMTSVLPNMLVEGIRRAIEVSPALKIYVCNVATQHGETDDFRVSDHYKTLKEHLKGNSPFEYVLANSNTDAVLPEAWHSQPVKVDEVTSTARASSRRGCRRRRAPLPPRLQEARRRADPAVLRAPPDRRAGARAGDARSRNSAASRPASAKRGRPAQTGAPTLAHYRFLVRPQRVQPLHRNIDQLRRQPPGARRPAPELP